MGAPGNLIAIATLAQRAPTPAPPAAEAGNVTVPERPAVLPGGLEDVIVRVCVTRKLCAEPHPVLVADIPHGEG